MATTSADDDLLSRARTGDRAAVQSLLEDQYDFIRRRLYQLAGSTRDLEDLQQTVLLQIVKSLPRFRGDSPFRSWITGICVHVLRDHWRRKKTRSIVTHVDGMELARTTESQAADTADVVDSRRALRRAETALQTLSPAHREVFMLRTMYGHSIDEVAVMTKSAKSTTRMRLYYARKAFAKAWDAAGPASEADENEEESHEHPQKM